MIAKVGQLWKFKYKYCDDQRVFVTTEIDDTHVWFQTINDEDEFADGIPIQMFADNHVMVSDV